MREAARSEQGRPYKEYVLAALDLSNGHTALDVGCGPGTDLLALAAGVGPAGSVIGIDGNPAMVAQARAGAGGPTVEVILGDAHALPVSDNSVDRIRVDRMLQHVRDPARVIAELRRVSRPGALVALAEPDWATLTIDTDDVAISNAFVGFICSDVVRNARIGRGIARLAQAAGFQVLSVRPFTPVFDEFTTADKFLGLGRVSGQAVRRGVISPVASQRWLDGLAAQPFLATFVLFTVIAQAPA
jgi:ubiquinone/menaquinone biosynthesis C-methylase UbiE